MFYRNKYSDKYKCNKNKCNRDKFSEIETHYADYVIVGTGTAGSVLARVLSDDLSTSVISIEAGENKSMDKAIKESAFAGIEYGLEQNFFSAYFWQIDTVTQGGLISNPITGECNGQLNGVPVSGNCIDVPGFPAGTGTVFSLPDRMHYTGGRLLGGSSSINGQQYVRGTPELYRQWVKQTGSNIWSPENVLQAFKEMENYTGFTQVPSEHGYCGPISIRQAPLEPTIMATKFVKGVANGTGYAQYPSDDYNAFNPESKYKFGSFTKWQLFQKTDKTRESSNTAFLNETIMDNNGNGLNNRKLKVFFKTTLLRIIWNLSGDKPRAMGIETLCNGKVIRLMVKNKLIISAGILSPHILQQNGIGPAIQLQNLGIKPIVNNPNVGVNMTNHLLLTAVLTANPNDIGIPSDDIQCLYTGGAFLPSLLPGDNKNMHGYQLIGANPAPGTFIIIVMYLQPKSKGIMREQSTDPLTFQLIDTKYFVDELDLKAFQLAFSQYIIPIATAMNAIDNTYNLVSPAVDIINDFDKFSDYALDSYDFAHHWQGMCRMGKSIESAVVDPVGKVFGTENLMVVDTEIAPIQSDGNTAAPAFLVGWQIAKYLNSLKN